MCHYAPQAPAKFVLFSLSGTSFCQCLSAKCWFVRVSMCVCISLFVFQCRYVCFYVSCVSFCRWRCAFVSLCLVCLRDRASFFFVSVRLICLTCGTGGVRSTSFLLGRLFVCPGLISPPGWTAPSPNQGLQGDFELAPVCPCSCGVHCCVSV